MDVIITKVILKIYFLKYNGIRSSQPKYHIPSWKTGSLKNFTSVMCNNMKYHVSAGCGGGDVNVCSESDMCWMVLIWMMSECGRERIWIYVTHENKKWKDCEKINNVLIKCQWDLKYSRQDKVLFYYYYH